MTLPQKLTELKALYEKATPETIEFENCIGGHKLHIGGENALYNVLAIGKLYEAIPELIQKLEKCIQTLELITKCGHPTTCPKKEFEYCESGCEQKTMALETLMEIGAI